MAKFHGMSIKLIFSVVEHHHYMLPSGKHTKNYGKSPFSMGKSTIYGNFQ
jgi:hypothetical protein